MEKGRPAKPRVVLSLDIESDGPAPLVHNCLMVGICAAQVDVPPGSDGWIVAEREWCLAEQPGCAADPKCLDEFWAKLPELRKYIADNAVPVDQFTAELSDWLRMLNKRFTVTAWAARPASFDYQWITCLYHRWRPAKAFPIPFSIRCISSMYKTLEACGFRPPGTWKSPDLPHTHRALEDARGQAYQYVMMCQALAAMRLVPAAEPGPAAEPDE